MISILKSRAGVTLAELLTVIAVFVILISAMIPTYQKARHEAASAECLNNLKTIGMAIQAYLKDYDDCLPDYRLAGQAGDPVYPSGYSWHSVVKNAQGQRCGWSYTLQDYLSDTSVFYCPADLAPEPERTYAGSYRVRYVTSTFMPQQVGAVRNSMAKRPSRLVYIYEQNNWHRNFGYPFIGEPKHPDYPDRGADIGTQYCNALFMDGHVASWPVPANWYTYAGYAGYQRFWFYGDVNNDNGINVGNEGLISLIDFMYLGQLRRCDPYDTKR